MKRRIRYPVLKLGMIFGIIIAYLSFAFADKMSRERNMEEKDVEEYQKQENSMCISMRYNSNGADVFHELDNDFVTNYIVCTPLYANAEKTTCFFNVYINLPEKFPYDVLDGEIPTKEMFVAKEPVIVLGQGLKNMVIHRDDGDYYELCGEEYKVVAYVASKRSGSLDYIRVLFYDNLGENARKDIDYLAHTMGITVMCRSNDVDLSTYFKQKKKALSGKVEQISRTQDVVEDSFTTNNTLVNYQKYAYLLYVFSVVLIVMIVELWIIMRKHEFAIRRAVGYSAYQIIRMISKEIIGILMCVGVVLRIIQFFVQGLTLDEMKTGIVTYILFVMITFVMLIIYPFYKIMTMDVASSLQYKEG